MASPMQLFENLITFLTVKGEAKMTDGEEKKGVQEKKARLKKRNLKTLSADINKELYDTLDRLKKETHVGKMYLVEEALQLLFEKYKDKLK